MKNDRENSVLIGDTSFFKNKSYNETVITHFTRESGEKDYTEYILKNKIFRLASLISKAVDDNTNGIV